MPAQFLPLFTITLVAFSAAVELVAAGTLAQQRVITADAVLRAWCIIGAVIGGVLAVAVWPPVADSDSNLSFRMMIVKFIGATLLGFVCGPMACRYLDDEVNQDVVMFVAAMIGFAGVPVIHYTAPVLLRVWQRFAERWLEKKAERYLSDKDNLWGLVMPLDEPRKRDLVVLAVIWLVGWPFAIWDWLKGKR